jgi:hypothetical protein
MTFKEKIFNDYTKIYNNLGFDCNDLLNQTNCDIFKMQISGYLQNYKNYIKKSNETITKQMNRLLKTNREYTHKDLENTINQKSRKCHLLNNECEQNTCINDVASLVKLEMNVYKESIDVNMGNIDEIKKNIKILEFLQSVKVHAIQQCLIRNQYGYTNIGFTQLYASSIATEFEKSKHKKIFDQFNFIKTEKMDDNIIQINFMCSETNKF